MEKDKNFSNLSVEKQKRIIAECCEAVNDEQRKLVDNFYNQTRGSMQVGKQR